jgi:hypothetical protein
MVFRVAVYGATLLCVALAGLFEMRIRGAMEASLDWKTQGLDVVPRALRNVPKEYERRNPEDTATIRKYRNLVLMRTIFAVALVIEVIILQR